MGKTISIGLEKKLARFSSPKIFEAPTIFNLSKPAEARKLNRLFAQQGVQCVVDDYKEQVHELFAIQNPTLVYTVDFEKKFEEYFTHLTKNQILLEQGRWVYYPWLLTVVHILPDREFQAVRTARNRNLISTVEQQKFYDATIGIGGLSVGNSIALAIALQGGARSFKLADFDRLALSNLNRVRAGVQYLGQRKVELTAQQIYELNPYAKIFLYPDGLTEKNIKHFFQGPPKLDLVIDELDNIAVKYLIRQHAKKFRVPLLMGADNGDNAVVDIERYDLHKDTKFFHGRVGETSYEQLKNLDKFGIGRTITKHIGPENITQRMQDSLLAMGKTIVSWPQLGGAALLNGSAVAYAARKVLNNQSIEGNRAIISLDEKLDPSYNTKLAANKRKKSTRGFKKIMGL